MAFGITGDCNGIKTGGNAGNQTAHSQILTTPLHTLARLVQTAHRPVLSVPYDVHTRINPFTHSMGAGLWRGHGKSIYSVYLVLPEAAVECGERSQTAKEVDGLFGKP
ncbi:hypothetical protein DFH06DRAFT_1118903 [Mycena polygramma]|nr:hypothetical protein DFH06DRAFT_1118903 [Mycena polygramma]